MSTLSPEQVLCAHTADLPAAWLPSADALAVSPRILFETLTTITPHWLDRPDAETDPAFKQWIPYVLIRNRRGELAAYPRQGTESRLHGLWSMGIGGHINPVDQGAPLDGPDFQVFWQTAFDSGFRRELAEEFPAAVPGETRFLGLIHEDRTEVGRVHLGLVYLHETGIIHSDPGPELAGLQWLPETSLGSAAWPLERFELWTRLALKLFQSHSI